MLNNVLTAEKYSSKVCAAFDSEYEAKQSIIALTRNVNVDQIQMNILRPDDKDFEQKLEPERKGIRDTLVRSHLILGATGLVSGVILYFILYSLDIAMVTQSPYFAFFVVIAFSTTAGLMLGGLASLRPDHDPMIQFARNNSASKRFVLLVHAADRLQKNKIKDILQDHTNSVIATF